MTDIAVTLETPQINVSIEAGITVINQTSTWLTGEGEPTSEVGEISDYYIDTETGDFYKKTDEETWELQGNLRGPPGISSGYTHTQSVPASTRTMTHNLGYNPNYIAVDSIGRQFHGVPTRPDENTMVLTLSASISGVAYLT